MSCLEQLEYVAGPRYNASAVLEYDTPFNFNWMALNYMAACPQGPPSFVNGSSVTSQALPSGCYLQDAKGSFINVDGTPAIPNPKTGVLKKSIRPMSGALAVKEGCPDSVYTNDGVLLADKLFTPAANYLTRPLDIINADGEVFVAVDTPAEVYNYSLDPTVKKDFEASVQYPDWLAYWSAWRARITTGITAGFIDDPKLASGILKDAAFSMYQIQGTNTGKPSRYGCDDIYMEHPHMWWGFFGADHGIGWLLQTRASEISFGDTLFSPFVACGQEEINTRPAQWLGLLKVMAAWGAEFFYAGFFNVHQDSHGK
eukprot:gene15718-14498_t